jgi:hypothetical protein
MLVYGHIVGDRQRKLFEVSYVVGALGGDAYALNGLDEHPAKGANDAHRRQSYVPTFADGKQHLQSAE